MRDGCSAVTEDLLTLNESLSDTQKRFPLQYYCLDEHALKIYEESKGRIRSG